MEHVAGRAEALSKEKVTDPPPPFRERQTESIYTKVYASNGADARNKRAAQRRIRQSAVEKLGEKEYRKLIQEVDFWTYSSMDIDKMVNKRVNEIQERLDALRKEEEAAQKRTTRSQAGTSTDPIDDEPVPTLKSPARKNVGGKKPKTPDRKNVGGKKPKTPERKKTAGKTPKEQPTKSTATKPTTTDGKKTVPQASRHIDDDEFELDLATGKFIQKNKVVDKPDESASRKRKADDRAKPSDTGDESRSRSKKSKKTDAEPLLEEEDDDLMIMDDEDKDKDYEPDEDDQLDEDEQPALDDDDDDFDIPPLRARKTDKKELKQKKKKSTQRGIETSVGEALSDETLSLFQKIVGENFEVRASEEFEEESSEKTDRCINPVEAAGFRATMKTLALELKKAVRKGTNIKETYVDMINSTIRVAKAMKYPGAAQVETEHILESIKDVKCNAWRKYLQGKTTMNPQDVVGSEQDDAPPSAEDLLIQQNMLGEETTKAAAEVVDKLPKMLKNDVHRKIHNMLGHIEQAHRHAAEATKNLRDLHDDLPTDMFFRLADAVVRPLVVMHIPKTEALVSKLKEAGAQRLKRMLSGSYNVVDVMIDKNLPTRGTWTMDEDFKPRKMIAAIIHKYVRDAMLKEPTTTKTIVDEFEVPKTTIHRQIWGKKYTGGGQKFERKRQPAVKASGSGVERKKVAAVIIKRSAETEKLVEVAGKSKDSKGKGKGKSSSSGSRQAEDIRKDSTAEEETRKRKQKALQEQEIEDPDLPTREEIAASKPASKHITIHF